MKKFFALAITALLIASLAACVNTKKADQTRVKCPACGYEFAVPAPN